MDSFQTKPVKAKSKDKGAYGLWLQKTPPRLVRGTVTNTQDTSYDMLTLFNNVLRFSSLQQITHSANI